MGLVLGVRKQKNKLVQQNNVKTIVNENLYTDTKDVNKVCKIKNSSLGTNKNDSFL